MSLDVLIVSQPAEYGVATCVRQLTETAVAAGHRVVVACPVRACPFSFHNGWVASVPIEMMRYSISMNGSLKRVA